MADRKSKLNFGLILAVYLLGIFMGALDTGIVTPARTVVQESLGVGDKAGIWMITIYTLAYAASIPVMGKLADRIGRRTVYLIAITLFGGGSLACGLSHAADSFTMLLLARAVQAIGGGGIMPVATAEFGTTFPEEKRGMALGMVGGVYGIANIFGASAGSLVMDIFGTNRWEFVFYVNVPIAVFILIAGFLSLPNTRDKAQSKIDGLGIMVLVVMVLCVMYGLKNIDFFDFAATITSTDVYPFLIVFAALLPFFIMIERRAEDPVMNLHYFTNPRILVTLGVSIITGIVLMGVIFVPQFCENALQVPTGKGGYFVIILGVFAGLGAPFSGKLTDKFGPKLVLGFGLLASVAGAMIFILFSTTDPNRLNVFGGLACIGLGIGFTMGAPLNYMMLWEVDQREANSALATLSLVRSLGTVVAPAIMVGFIAHAGAGLMDPLMELMPTEIKVPKLPYAAELTKAMREQGIRGVPDLDSMTTVKLDMKGSDTSDVEMPEELISDLKDSDVTTITSNVKNMAEYMFDQMSPKMQKKIDKGVNQGIDGVSTGIDKMTSSIKKMKKAQAGMQKGADGIQTAIDKQTAALKKMKEGRAGISKGIHGISKGINGVQQGINGVGKGIDGVSKGITGLNKGIAGLDSGISKMQAAYDQMPSYVPDRAKLGEQLETMKEKRAAMQDKLPGMKQQLAQMKKKQAGMKKKQASMKGKRAKMVRGRNKLDQGIRKLTKVRNQLISKRKELLAQKAKMGEAIAGIREGRQEAKDQRTKMKKLKAAIPGAFEKAEQTYLAEIDARDAKIRKAFQDTLNVGFRQIYLMTAITSAVGLVMLLLYRRRKES